MNSRAFAALFCALWLPAAVAAEPRWTSVRSQSLTVIGDGSAGALRDVAIELEQFRAVLGRLGPTGRPAATAPTTVYVFGTRKALEPFLPLQNGRPAPLGGYCARDVDANAIAFSTEGFLEGAPIIFHEYTHLLLGTAVRSIPIWLNEGLAEYYSTFRLRSGGKGAELGRPVARHVQLLREAFIPLAQLLAVGTTSELYDESLRRSIFYAESWALTHFLMTEVPSGQALITQYAGAFGAAPAAFEHRLRDYMHRMAFTSLTYTFKDRLESDMPLPARLLSRGDAGAWLGDLQRRIRRPGEAAARIEAAAAAEPDNPVALLGLGRLRLSQNRAADGWPALVGRGARSGLGGCVGLARVCGHAPAGVGLGHGRHRQGDRPGARARRVPAPAGRRHDSARRAARGAPGAARAGGAHDRPRHSGSRSPPAGGTRRRWRA